MIAGQRVHPDDCYVIEHVKKTQEQGEPSDARERSGNRLHITGREGPPRCSARSEEQPFKLRSKSGAGLSC